MIDLGNKNWRSWLGLAAAVLGLIVMGGRTKVVAMSAATIHPNPVLSWGNTSYHDSLGIRDPYVVRDGSNYNLFFDCTEDLLNPSFEPNWGTNGWNAWGATIDSTTADRKFGERSLRVVTQNQVDAGAYTGDYLYPESGNELAMPGGLEVVGNTHYVASVFVKAAPGVTATLLVMQYTDDPYFFGANLMGTTTTAPSVRVSVVGNNDWQRLVIPFMTEATARVVTISLIGSPNSTTYWDGVQLERTTANVALPFPESVQEAFNDELKDTIGWKTCYATSVDGINFTKKGRVRIEGTRNSWEDFEKPGWVGASGIYISPFYYNGQWYSYTWVAGYPVEAGNQFIVDQGEADRRRFGYGDRRGFLPNGNPTRSSLVISSQSTGPYQRVAMDKPPIRPAGCGASVNDWGCSYLTANGVPIGVGNTYVEFLSGLREWDSWTNIASGVGFTSNLAANTWEMVPNNPIIQPKSDLVPEGPIYYYDQQSKYHFLFVNNLRTMTVEAFWSVNKFTNWDESNRQVVIPNNLPWASGSRINLATVVANDQNQLNLYFGNRPGSIDQSYGRAYLFHDIGLATIALPLLPNPPAKRSELISMERVSRNKVNYTVAFEDSGGVSNIAQTQLVIGRTADWRGTTSQSRSMNVRVASGSLQAGNYLYGSGPENYGWGLPKPDNTLISNNETATKLMAAQTADGVVTYTWQVTLKPAFARGDYQIYTYMKDINGGEDEMTLPAETVIDSGVSYVLPKVGGIRHDPVVGDVNGDRLVNTTDLSIILANFNATVVCGDGGDLDDNCVVDIFDYNLMVSHFGEN